MGMVNSNGNYMKISNVDITNTRVTFNIFKSLEIRNNPTVYDNVLMDSIHCATLDSILLTQLSTGSLKTDLITAGYTALKNEPPFNNASTEQWTDC